MTRGRLLAVGALLAAVAGLWLAISTGEGDEAPVARTPATVTVVTSTTTPAPTTSTPAAPTVPTTTTTPPPAAAPPPDDETLIADTCPPTGLDPVDVVQSAPDFGCDRIADMAIETVNGGGFYEDPDSVYQCRWGQGGTREVEVDGERYLPGYCLRMVDQTSASFLARQRPAP